MLLCAAVLGGALAQCPAAGYRVHRCSAACCRVQHLRARQHQHRLASPRGREQPWCVWRLHFSLRCLSGVSSRCVRGSIRTSLRRASGVSSRGGRGSTTISLRRFSGASSRRVCGGITISLRRLSGNSSRRVCGSLTFSLRRPSGVSGRRVRRQHQHQLVSL